VQNLDEIFENISLGKCPKICIHERTPRKKDLANAFAQNEKKIRTNLSVTVARAFYKNNYKSVKKIDIDLSEKNDSHYIPVFHHSCVVLAVIKI